MKCFFVFILLLDVHHIRGQQQIEEFEQILLNFSFPSSYNDNNKSCCKLYPGGCYKLLDTAGYVCDLLKGRVKTTEGNGRVQIQISNVQYGDGGYYRCSVVGSQIRFYKDYYVEIFESHHHYSQSQPPQTSTLTTPSTTPSPTDSTGPVLAQDRSARNSVPWSFGLPLAVIVTITVMITITSAVGIICCRIKGKQKQSVKIGKTPCDSRTQEAPEVSGIVYTTVDFKVRQKTEEIYANVMMDKAAAAAGSLDPEPAGMVEYSTLAIHL